MSTLTLNIKSGSLQKSYDIIGAMENYVVLNLIIDGRSQRVANTKIVKGEKLKPIVWNESVDIKVPKNSWSNAVLEVIIMDEDVTTDDVCARGKINLEHCGFFQQSNVTIPYTIKLYGEQSS